MIPVRSDGRSFDQLRPLTITYDVYGYADAGVLLELGNTKVWCTVHLQVGVPPFLKGTKTGWLKAEYAMLPTATQVRTQREFCTTTRNGRSVEISRLIGRSLRVMLDIAGIGERTVIVDCDVLQADGGTRTACITAASLALVRAQERWLAQNLIQRPVVSDPVVGVSVGVLNNHALLDLSFQEDSAIDADFNIVFTKSGALVEIQGTAEKKAVSWETFELVRKIAHTGALSLFNLFDKSDQKIVVSKKEHKQAGPLFSLSNRGNISSS